MQCVAVIILLMRVCACLETKVRVLRTRWIHAVLSLPLGHFYRTLKILSFCWWLQCLVTFFFSGTVYKCTFLFAYLLWSYWVKIKVYPFTSTDRWFFGSFRCWPRHSIPATSAAITGSITFPTFCMGKRLVSLLDTLITFVTFLLDENSSLSWPIA